MSRSMLIALSLVVASVFALVTTDAWARAGGGGSRGSRSFSSPSRSSGSFTPASPSRQQTQPQPTPMTPAARPGLFGGFMGAMAGFALGGLLGSLLFGGFGGWGHGIGLLDIVLLGAAALFVMSWLRRRREAERPAYATVSAYGGRGVETAGGPLTVEMPAGGSDLERGLAHVRSMDPRFDPDTVAELARRMFPAIQQAVMMRDLGALRDHIMPEMLTALQSQCDRLRADKRTNRLERLDIRGAEVTEAWQEGGQDYVTVCLTGSLIDYTVDDTSGAVVEGSRTDRQEFEEFWTLARPVGPNRWKLSAIQAA